MKKLLLLLSVIIFISFVFPGIADAAVLNPGASCASGDQCCEVCKDWASAALSRGFPVYYQCKMGMSIDMCYGDCGPKLFQKWYLPGDYGCGPFGDCACFVCQCNNMCCGTGETCANPYSTCKVPACKNQGDPCANNSECCNNTCIDGFCCDSVCSDICKYCDDAEGFGACINVPNGMDPDNECPGTSGNGDFCNGAGACQTQASCKALGASCSLTNSNLFCCTGYGCLNGICTQICNNDEHCDTGAGETNANCPNDCRPGGGTGGGVILYIAANYEGPLTVGSETEAHVFTSNVSNLNDFLLILEGFPSADTWNDEVSSMKISPGYNVKLCKAANYGECLSQIFTTDVANFVDIDFNDTLSSVEITYGGAGCGDTICSPPQENANNCPADCGGSVPGSQPMPKGHLNLTYPSFLNLDLNMPLNQLIAQLYYFIIAISGLAVFVMLVWGGFEYLTSTGNPSKIGNAKERITSALLGLLIILASYLILQVINPDLLTLTLPQIQH